MMEGKAVLFKEFGGVDAWPVCLATKDVDEIVRTVIAIAPVFGGINLEDISAPRCFEVESRLREALDIPVFHDDQHGTAIVVLASLINALRVVGKELPDVRIVLTGVGAAGTAVTKTLLAAGARDIVGCDRQGALFAERTGLAPAKAEYAGLTNPRDLRCSADEALVGADVYIGLSTPGAVSADRDPAHGRSRDRVRDGQSRSRGHAGGDRKRRRGDRDRPLRLPEPDQQRPRLPGRVSGRARRAGQRDHEGDGGRCSARDRFRRQARRARGGLHRPERLQPRRRPGGRQGRRTGGRVLRCRPQEPPRGAADPSELSPR